MPLALLLFGEPERLNLEIQITQATVGRCCRPRVIPATVYTIWTEVGAGCMASTTDAQYRPIPAATETSMDGGA